MGNRSRIAIELIAVGAIAAIALGFGIRGAGMASGYVDPLLHAGAQDEAVYGHAAARMARGNPWQTHWLTPVFLERFMLNKPPLLMWAGAASMRLAGISPLALRLPVLASGVLCCLLVYCWLRRSHSMPAAFSGVVLLAGTPVFHSMARKFMTDTLLALFVVTGMLLIVSDPRWERRQSEIAFGVLSGAAIMTKSAAGLLPLLILAVYWAFAGQKERPAVRKVLAAFAVAALVAAPWHVYEFVAHKEWFIAEYVRFQLLGSGLTAPSRYTADSSFWFYLKTLLHTDPLLLALSLTSLPWMALACKGAKTGTKTRANLVQARLLAGWLVTAGLCLGIFGTRAAYYLLPLLPALALASVEFSPLFRGRMAWAACAALIAAFGVKAWTGEATWGLDYAPNAAPAASALDGYAHLHRANELVVVSPDDEFYASVLDLPKIRYLYLTPLDATKTSEFFYRLGMIVSAGQFCSLGSLMPVYEQRLRAWELPENLHPEATLIAGGAISQLAGIIRCSPDRDFMIPQALREIAVTAGNSTHTAGAAQSGKFFLLSNHSIPRPEGFIAPGTLIR